MANLPQAKYFDYSTFHSKWSEPGGRSVPSKGESYSPLQSTPFSHGPDFRLGPVSPMSSQMGLDGSTFQCPVCKFHHPRGGLVSADTSPHQPGVNLPPPFTLIPFVLNNLHRAPRSVQAIMVAPHKPHAPWWPLPQALMPPPSRVYTYT